LSELRELGANLDPARWPGLRSPRWRERLVTGLAYRSTQAEGSIELGFEVVYGHAFKPLPARRAAPQATIALEDLRATARARRTGSGNRGP
jgi:malonyl-CoA O-methyltransferase